MQRSLIVFTAWVVFHPLIICRCSASALPPIDYNTDPGFEYHPLPESLPAGHDRAGSLNNELPASSDLYRAGGHMPQIILKLDDLDANTLEPFTEVADYLRSVNTKGSFGVIVQRMAGLGRSAITTTRCNRLKQLQSSGLFEIWNHGGLHVPKEIVGRNLRQQIKLFSVTQALLRSCGITARAFGAPYNANDKATLQAIRALPDIDLWFFPQIDTFTPEDVSRRQPLLLDPRKTRLDIEPQVGIVSYGFFEKSYQRMIGRGSDVLVIQGHPADWLPEHFNAFKKIVTFLRKKGHRFITPSEYVANVKR